MAEENLLGNPGTNGADFYSLKSNGDASSCQTAMNTFLKVEAVFMGLVCGLGMIVNILAVCILLSYRNRLHFSGKCAINRAMADMLTLFTNVIDVLVHIRGSWTFSCVLCKLRSSLALIGPLVSSAMLMALTGDCLMESWKPGSLFFFLAKERLKLLGIFCNVAWSISIIYGIPTFLQSEIFKEVTGERIHCVSLPLSEDTSHSQSLRLLYIFQVCLIPLLTNWAFVFNILRHRGETFFQTATSKINKKGKQRWKLIISLLVSFTVCQIPFWMPYLFHELVSTPLSIFIATLCFPAINAALNPIFYIYFLKDLLETEEEGEQTQMGHETLSLKSLSTKSLERNSSHISLK